MIPYDDLVAALSQWRARQGLPVSTLGGSASGGTKAGSGPNTAPARLQSEAEVLDADDYEQAYDEGGEAPERPTHNDMSRGGRDDW